MWPRRHHKFARTNTRRPQPANASACLWQPILIPQQCLSSQTYGEYKQNLICNIFETPKFLKSSLSCKFVDTPFFKNRLKNPRHHFLFSLWWRFRFPQIYSPNQFFWLFFIKFFGHYWRFWKLWCAISRWIRRIWKSYEKNPTLDFNTDSKYIIKI